MLKTLIKITKYPLLLPFYHLVSDAPPLFVKNLYKPKTVKQFKKDLDVFLEFYEPITLEKVIQFNKGEITLTKPSFHITFDDGLANFYHIIAPILKERNIPATVFLNTDFVDNKELFYRYKASLLLLKIGKTELLDITGDVNDLLKKSYKERHLLDDLAKEINFDIKAFLKKEKPYLNMEQIKELQKQGFTFGAHSTNHPLYKDISLKEQIKQTEDSLRWIQDNLQEKHSVFSFPFHDIDVSKPFFEKIKNMIDLTFGTSGFKKDEISTNLHRLDMEKSVIKVKKFLIREYIRVLPKRIFGRYTIKRK